jgi:hypothetical protein
MIWGSASIAQKEDIFIIGLSADRTRVGLLLLFKIVLNPRIWVELGNLFLIFDNVFGNDGA